MSLVGNIKEQVGRLLGSVRRTSVQPAELARRLVTEMDASRKRSVQGMYVSNVYDIYLSEADHAQFQGRERALAGELAEYVAEHARSRSYTLVTRPRVKLHIDAELERGTFGIASRLDESSQQAPHEVATSTMVQPAVVAPAGVPVGPASLQLVSSGRRHSISARMALGRGRSNDIVLDDSSVSREHAEIVIGDDGAILVRDLDSTNGVFVNGERVRESRIGPGDRIFLGNAQLSVEQA